MGRWGLCVLVGGAVGVACVLYVGGRGSGCRYWCRVEVLGVRRDCHTVAGHWLLCSPSSSGPCLLCASVRAVSVPPLLYPCC